MAEPVNLPEDRVASSNESEQRVRVDQSAQEQAQDAQATLETTQEELESRLEQGFFQVDAHFRAWQQINSMLLERMSQADATSEGRHALLQIHEFELEDTREQFLTTIRQQQQLLDQYASIPGVEGNTIESYTNMLAYYSMVDEWRTRRLETLVGEQDTPETTETPEAPEEQLPESGDSGDQEQQNEGDDTTNQTPGSNDIDIDTPREDDTPERETEPGRNEDSPQVDNSQNGDNNENNEPATPPDQTESEQGAQPEADENAETEGQSETPVDAGQLNQQYAQKLDQVYKKDYQDALRADDRNENINYSIVWKQVSEDAKSADRSEIEKRIRYIQANIDYHTPRPPEKRTNSFPQRQIELSIYKDALAVKNGDSTAVQFTPPSSGQPRGNQQQRRQGGQRRSRGSRGQNS